MTKIPLVTFHLAQSAIKTYPQTQFLNSASFGDFFYADFIFPFPLNPDIFASLQEGLIRLIKEAPEHQIMEMLPKIAKDFLNHHAKKDLANQVPLDANTVFVLILGKTYYLTLDEIAPLELHPTLKLIDYVTFLNEDGDKITRIYGHMAEDLPTLKQKQKLAQAFFQKPIWQRLQHSGLITVNEGQIAFTTSAMKYALDLLFRLEGCLKPLDVMVIDADCQRTFKGQACIVSDFDSFKQSMPIDQMLFTRFLRPYILLEKELDTKKERKNLITFLLKFYELVKQMGFSIDCELSAGQDMAAFADEVAKAIDSKWRSYKARAKMQLKLRTQHRLGLHLPLLQLILDQKNDKDFLKIEFSCHPYAYMVWQEDKKNG
jgi:hypothetical protein